MWPLSYLFAGRRSVIFALSDAGWRSTVKIGLGRAPLRPRPRYGRRLLDLGDPATFSLTDRLMTAGGRRPRTSRSRPG